MAENSVADQINTDSIVGDVLATIDREREREIISRRFGLFDPKETLEQIGELLGITRERVRQLEKSVITRLKHAAEEGEVPHISEVETMLVDTLDDLGGVARLSEVSGRVTENN